MDFKVTSLRDYVAGLDEATKMTQARAKELISTMKMGEIKMTDAERKYITNLWDKNEQYRNIASVVKAIADGKKLDEACKKKMYEETDEYKEFFQKKLEKYGVESPEELSDEEKKNFFDEVDKEWKSDAEEEGLDEASFESKYGRSWKQDLESIIAKMKEKNAKDISDKEIERTLKGTVASVGITRMAKEMVKDGILTKKMLNEAASQFRHMREVVDALHEIEVNVRGKWGKLAGECADYLMGIKESWETDYKTPESERGKYKGKTLEEIRSMLDKLKASGPHEEGSKEYEDQNELEFAIRAKTGWGEV